MAQGYYRVAVIGAGRAGGPAPAKGGGHQIGYSHAAAYERAADRLVLESVADIDDANRMAFQERFRVKLGFSNYLDMLAELQPDVVSICTYVGMHGEMLEAAAGAGVKAVLCEKPLVASPKQLYRVQKVAEDSGMKVMVPHLRRYLPVFRRACELYNSSDVVGQQLMCLAGIAGWDLSEWGSHWLDMFRFFHGDQPVKWVFGQARVRGARGYGHAMEDHGCAYFEFANGGRGLVDGGQGLSGGQMVLLGTEGSIRISGQVRLELQAGSGLTSQEDFSDDPRSSWSAVWDAMVRDLVLWLDGGKAPELALDNIAKTCELNLGCYLSALCGDRVDFPLTTEQREYDEWPVEALARRSAGGSRFCGWQ